MTCGHQIRRHQHPTYSYEDFIEGYRPDGQGGFALSRGLFRRVADAARDAPTQCYVLIIDEINRGNIPRIFGELITLLERSKRGDFSLTLPLSRTNFSVPDNLVIIGTMNTADRSILVLDTALRRRFGFIEVMPEPAMLRSSHIGETPLSVWLRALNQRIVEHLGRDGRNLQIGHAYLMRDGHPLQALDEITAAFRQDIWPLLQEYCYDDVDALAAILASARGGVYDAQRQGLRHEIFVPGNESALIAALNAIVSPAAWAEELADTP